MESLIRAGAFDSSVPENGSINKFRAQLFVSIDEALKSGQQAWEAKNSGQVGLFGGGDNGFDAIEIPLPDAEPWTSGELSKNEKTAVGFYLTAHPLDSYAQKLEQLGIESIGALEEKLVGAEVYVCGIVESSAVKYSKKGNRFCIFRVEDQSGGAKCLAWSEAFTKFGSLVVDDAIIAIKGKIESNDSQETTIIVNEIQNISELMTKLSRGISIVLPQSSQNSKIDEIQDILLRESGTNEVRLEIPLGNGIVVDIVSNAIRVKGSEKLAKSLQQKGCTVTWFD